MNSTSTQSMADFQALAQQYWKAWSELAGQGGAVSGAPGPGWSEALAWWKGLAGQGRGEIESTLERFTTQAGTWFGAMQDLAGAFAGRDAGATDVARAWREMMGGAGGRVVADLFQRIGGREAVGAEAWQAQVAPLLGMWKQEMGSILGMPTFGLSREHQERAQRLGQHAMALQEANAAYHAELQRAARLAFDRFESKLAERGEPGRQIESARALFDLWIDAAEEAWSEVALSSGYRQAYAQHVNALMRMRLALRDELEQLARALGLPTRSEVDGAARRLAALEREVHQLRNRLRDAPPRAAGPTARPVADVASVAEPAPIAASSRRTKPAAPKSAAARAKAGSAAPTRRATLPKVAAPTAIGAGRSGAKSAAAPSSRSRSATRRKVR